MFGEQEAPRLQVLQRCDAMFGKKDAPQVAFAHAQRRGQVGDAQRLALAHTLVQALRGLACERS